MALFRGNSEKVWPSEIGSGVPNTVLSTGSDGRVAWLPPAAAVSVRGFGAVGDGVHDDTAAFVAAFASVQSLHGEVYMPTGHYRTTENIVQPSYVSLVGDGSGASLFYFDPPSDATCLTVSAVAASTIKNSIRGVGFYDVAFTHTNVALELVDVSSCIVDDIYVFGSGTGSPAGPYWKGRGVVTKGREATSCSNWRIVTTGHGLNIAANPNTARGDGEDIDHWNFHNMYFVTDKTGSASNIHVDDGIGLIDLSFTGYQAWVGSGADHFYWNDDRGDPGGSSPTVPTVISRNVVWENVRTEQNGSTSNYGFNLTCFEPCETLGIVNALISATSAGIRINGCLQATLDRVIAAQAAGINSLKMENAVGQSTLTIRDSYWQPSSLFDVTGYNLILGPSFSTQGPSNAVYANTLTGSSIMIKLITILTASATKGFKVFATGGDGLTVLPQASGSGVQLRSENEAETDYQDMALDFDGLLLRQRTGVGTTATIIEVATGTTPKIGFYGVTTTARQLLATGAAHTVDDVITALQTLGLVKQS